MTRTKPSSGPGGALVDGRHADPGQGHRHAQPAGSGRGVRRGATTANSAVNTAWIWSTREDSPAGIPASMPMNSSPNFATPERQSDAHDPLPRDLGPADEEHRGQRRDQEAQGGEEQRREVVEADLDDDEVHAPDGGDEDGEGDVGRVACVEDHRPAPCSTSADSCMVG